MLREFAAPFRAFVAAAASPAAVVFAALLAAAPLSGCGIKGALKLPPPAAPAAPATPAPATPEAAPANPPAAVKQ